MIIRHSIHFIRIFILFLALFRWSFAETPIEAHNIILLIGDGMGLNQLTAASIYKFGAAGRLNMEKMPVTGLVRTHSEGELITDSGAAATALATGCKTNNRGLGVDASGKPLQTIIELARNKGMATGLVVTCSITHATPAAFAIHIGDRNLQDSIAALYVNAQVEVLLGGGRGWFIPRDQPGSLRRDLNNPLKRMLAAGYSLIATRDELLRAHTLPLLGLFGTDSLTTYPPEPSLAEMTKQTIQILGKDPDGFFLMVEGSQIDWACHQNDEERLIRQTLLFDEAVGEALTLSRKDPRTLTIVTADHETGGLAIKGGRLEGGEVKLEWANKKHTAAPVPLFAEGPGAERFSGLKDNADIGRMLKEIIASRNP